MRICITIAILIFYLGGIFRGMAPVAYYQLNQEYIVDFFCENKDRPELKCNGACHLNKKLREANQESGSAQTPAGLNVEIVDMSHAPEQVLSIATKCEDNRLEHCENEKLPSSHLIALDPPPPES